MRHGRPVEPRLRQVALARHLIRRAVRRARIELLVLLPALAGIFVIYRYRRRWSRRDHGPEFGGPEPRGGAAAPTARGGCASTAASGLDAHRGRGNAEG